MAVTNTAAFAQGINSQQTAFVNATGTTVTTVLTAGANGTRLTMLTAHSDDTSNKDFTIYVSNGGTDFPQTVISIPLGSGNTNSVPNVDLLKHSQWVGLPTDAFGNRYLDLKSGDTVKMKANAAVTAAKQVTVTARGFDF